MNGGSTADDTLTAVGQLAVTVSDVNTALAFYRDVLGLTFLFAPSPSLAFLQCGETRLMLTTPMGAGAVGCNSIAYFRTANIDTYFRQVRLRGAPVEREPACTARLPDHELWIGFLRDPDGNLVGVMEERATD